PELPPFLTRPPLPTSVRLAPVAHPGAPAGARGTEWPPVQTPPTAPTCLRAGSSPQCRCVAASARQHARRADRAYLAAGPAETADRSSSYLRATGLSHAQYRTSVRVVVKNYLVPDGPAGPMQAPQEKRHL